MIKIDISNLFCYMVCNTGRVMNTRYFPFYILDIVPVKLFYSIVDSGSVSLSVSVFYTNLESPLGWSLSAMCGKSDGLGFLLD